MASTATAIPGSPGAGGPSRAARGWAWYRRYYLLVNVPVLLLLTELLLVKVDFIHRWPFDEKNDLVKALRAYDARPPGPGDEVVLLLGNSATDRGLDAAAIEAALGAPARVYNMGLKGARLDDQRGLMELLFARGIRPRAVVLGINAYLIDHKVGSDTLYPWLERWTPYIYFHRSRLRSKAWRWVRSLVGLEKRKPGKEARETDEVPDGKTPESAIRTFLAQFDRRSSRDFPMIDELPDALAWFAAQGIAVHVVLYPMAGSGTRRLAEYDAITAAIRAKVPAGSLDLTHASDRFTDELFYDVGHPNRAGRAAVTQAVIPWLRARLGRAEPPRGAP